MDVQRHVQSSSLRIKDTTVKSFAELSGREAFVLRYPHRSWPNRRKNRGRKLKRSISRFVVERTFAWYQRTFRRLTNRWERKISLLQGIFIDWFPLYLAREIHEVSFEIGSLLLPCNFHETAHEFLRLNFVVNSLVSQ